MGSETKYKNIIQAYFDTIERLAFATVLVDLEIEYRD